MSISFRSMAVDLFVPMLTSLAAIFDKAIASAHAKNADPEKLLQLKLAPDMIPLVLQVHLACAHAGDFATRVMGKDPPTFNPKEKTLDEIKALIAMTIAHVKSATTTAFEGAENRTFVVPFTPGREFAMNGMQYLRDWALPHFYFHVVTAYDILRHDGVEIGKWDYLTHVEPFIRPSGEK